MIWLLSDCSYDYCDHMTVTGFVIKVTVDTSGFVSTGLPYERKEVDTIDPSDDLALLFKDIPRNPGVGDEDVDCSSIDEVCISEAGNQAGLATPSLNLGNIVRINYGNGQSELFQFTSKTTYGFLPTPGTRK